MNKRLKKVMGLALAASLVIPTMQHVFAADESSSTETGGGSTIYISSTGKDANDGTSASQAVSSLTRALELSSDGGIIQTDKTIVLNSDLSVSKSVTLQKTGAAGPTIIVSPNKKLSVTKGHTLSFKPSVSSPQTLFINNSATLSDGSYKFDYTGLSADDQSKSYAIFLNRGSSISGSEKGAVSIDVSQGDFLKTASVPDMSITNASITQSTPNKSGAYGGSANISLIDSTYTVSNTASNTFLSYDRVFKLDGSTFTVDLKNQPGNYYSVQFSTVPEIKNSTVDLKEYGSLFFTKNAANIENSTLKMDGLFDASANPRPIFQPGHFTSTALFRSDSEIHRFSAVDDKGNTYEYGLPYKHSSNAVVKDVPLPKVDLKFQNESGDKTVTIPIIKGSSFSDLEDKVYANNVKISKNLLNDIYDVNNIPKDKELKMLINGDETKPYQFTDTLNDDETVVLKLVDRNTSGIRYYLNDGSGQNNHYFFDEVDDSTSTLMTFDQITDKDSSFLLRSKKFLGWSASADGNDIITNLPGSGIRNVYAHWEDKKEFHVTYYRQNPNSGGASDSTKVEDTLYESEHLPGLLIDAKDWDNILTPYERSLFPVRNPNSNTFFNNAVFGSGQQIGTWTAVGSYGFMNILTDNYSGLYRTQGWNSASDGSGTYYRGGQELTEDLYEKTKGNLVLYNQWVELEWLKKTAAANIANPDLARPNITLASENTDPGNYESAADALVIDHSQALNYRATLDFSKIRKDLVTLWGRMDQVTEWYGEMNAYFDARLDFDKDVQVLYESTWQIPDQTKLAAYGIKDVHQVEGNPNRWIFTISKDQIMKNKVTNRTGTDTKYDSSGYEYYKVSIPVTILPKYSADGHDFQSLSFDDFMKPMTLTVVDNFNRGINAYVSRESLNRIAVSDKPVIIVGGDIEMHINGFERSGLTLLNYVLKSPAYDEHAKAYPAGLVESSYEIVNNDNYKDVITSFPNPATNKYKDEEEGRSANPNVVNDPNNYAENYAVSIPKAPLHDNKMNDLVAIIIQTQKVSVDGIPETNPDGSPKIEEKVYSDRYYTSADGLAGSLEEGRSLLDGSFDYRKNIHFILQYAAPKLNIQVTKKWVGPHTDHAKVELYIDGNPSGKFITLTADKDWKDQFSDLFRYDQTDGHKIDYTVKEVDTNPDYAVDVVGSDDSGFTVTNTNISKIDIPVKKIWVGEAGKDATIHLMANGKEIESYTLTANDNWSHTFKDMKCYDNGEEIKYSIIEDPVDNYKTDITGDAIQGFTVTNTQNKEPDKPQKPEKPENPHNPDKPEISEEPTKSNSDNNHKIERAVQTSDKGYGIFYFSLISSGAVALLLLIQRKRKKFK